MYRKTRMRALLMTLVLLGLVITACAPQVQEVEVVKTVVVTELVEKAGEEVEVTKVVTPTPEPEQPQIEIFHWWTAPGEREAADAMFAALADAYPEIEVVENPVAGGGGVSHRVVLLKAYVDGDALEPLDDLYEELGYADAIPGPLLNAVSIEGHPYVVPLNMHIQNILYYDMAVFDELGLEPPMNFDDLIAACEAIKGAYPDQAPLALGSVENWGAAFVLDSIILEVGGPEYYVSLFKGEVDVTTDETFRTALEMLADLTQYVTPGHSSLTWDQSVSEVISGNSTMVIMGTWGIGAFISGGWTPGEDFGAVTFPQEPERILLFHPDTYGLAKGAPHPESTMKWLRVVASPELQIPTDVTQGGMFARIDIDPSEFPDPIRQEMQSFLRETPGNLILDQHGSIAPASFSNEYWIVIAGFMAADEPDVDATIDQVATLFDTYDVEAEAAWYTWP
jgi:glucose/mannose transport system substrate-binding protein